MAQQSFTPADFAISIAGPSILEGPEEAGKKKTFIAICCCCTQRQSRRGTTDQDTTTVSTTRDISPSHPKTHPLKQHECSCRALSAPYIAVRGGRVSQSGGCASADIVSIYTFYRAKWGAQEAMFFHVYAETWFINACDFLKPGGLARLVACVLFGGCVLSFVWTTACTRPSKCFPRS